MDDGIRFFYGIVLLILGCISLLGVLLLAVQGKDIPPVLAAALGTVFGTVAALIPPGTNGKR